METAMKLRRLVFVDGRSIRSISKETGISRNTIRKYIKQETPPGYQRKQSPIRHKLSHYEPLIIQWLEHDAKRPKRERRTAMRIYEQLLLEGYSGSYSPVCRFIKQLSPNIHTSNASQVFIPLKFEPGDAMQFDWSTEVVELNGVEQRIKVAHFRLSYSRKPFIAAYFCEKQEMLFDAFNQALSFYQGVPKRVLIDNPKTMVTRIGEGKQRDFHPRFMALMNHYLIEPVACTPASGWEKGQVENQVRVIRNRVFKPRLSFKSLCDLNTHLMACCCDLGKKLHPTLKSSMIDDIFTQEHGNLRPLGKPFDGYIEKSVRVNSTSLVQYDTNHYSVPTTYAKQRVSLRIYADRIMVTCSDTLIASHVRSFNKHQRCFEPWHYVGTVPNSVSG